MQEQLISYLLGDLNANDRSSLEAKLQEHPALRQELERLRNCFDPDTQQLSAECCEQLDPPQKMEQLPLPRDLADRTAGCVSQLAAGLWANDNSSTPAGKIDPPSRRCSMSFVDLCVAVGVVMAVGMMLLPALRNSRDSSRRVACQNNMQTIGRGLLHYASDHGGKFPLIRPGENAGMFTVYLTEGGYVDRQQLAQRVVCKAASEADQVANRRIVIRIPTRQQIAATHGSTLAKLQRLMAVSYAYRLGYLENDIYKAIRSESPCRTPLLSDAPTFVNEKLQSINHGGYGQNVLFVNGSVKYQRDCRLPGSEDHLFVSNEGRVEIPHEWNDAVLMRSEAKPRVDARVIIRVPAVTVSRQ